MQAGGPAHRASTGSHAAQPSKILSDSANSSSCTCPSSVKGKKRERPDHNTSISKRDQSAMSSENDPSPPKRECLTKVAEFGSITDKDGGLPNLSAVDHLIHLMRQESKKCIDAASQRGALVGMIAATQREDCLQHFVQLGGLSILDDWLPEGHKGKAGDGNFKDTDQIMDEVTLTILHALEKLPINLEALKACSIGKAVNHLRSHRFSEVQKRAKKLVETWKKRVDLEMETTHNCESNGASGQAIGGYQKEITSFSAHLSPAKVGEDVETQKVSAESNSIAFSSDPTVTSGAGSSTSVNLNSSITQSCIGARPHGNSSVSPQKQESSSNACPSSSNGFTMICSPTQKENEKNCVANRTSSNYTKSEDMTRSVVKQKMAGKVVVCGRNMYDSEPNGLPDTVVAFGLKKGKNDCKNECSHDGSNDLFVSSMNAGVHLAAAPKHEKFSSGNTENQRLLSTEDETSIGVEASSAPTQSSWSQLATDKEIESKITKINMIEVNEWMENSREDALRVISHSVYDNNERRTTESFVIDDKNEHVSPERGISNSSTLTTFGSDQGIDSTCSMLLVETKNMKGMGCIEVKVMKENSTVGCTQSKELDHLGLQGSEEKHSGDLNSCKSENFDQEQPSTVAGYTEGLTWQSSKVTGLEGDVVRLIQSTKEDSSVFNHLEDKLAKQSLPIEATPACLDAKINQSLGEDGSGVAQDKRDAHLDGMDCENSSYSDCEADKADNAESRILQDFSSNTVHALIKNADSSNEGELLTTEKSPLDVSQEGNKVAKDKTNPLSSGSKLQNIANETLSDFITENCSKKNEVCMSPVGTKQSVKGSLKISYGTTLIEHSLEVTSGSVASPSNGSPQLVNTIILEKTQPRHDFDLNEGLTADDLLRDSATPCVSALISSSCTLSTPVAVVAATKGGFILPATSVHNKSEIGWKGSAANSAFRPAEPRRLPDRSQSIPDTKTLSTATVAIAKQFRNVFDFDLNVVDQGSSEGEMGISSETYAEFQHSSLLHSGTYLFPSRNSRLVPQSASKIDRADFDLNRGGEETDREIPPGSISETGVQQVTERQQKTLARPPMLDFDLNEGSIEDEVHEQVAHPVSATTSCTNVVNPLSVGELSGVGRSADISPWHQTCSSIPVVTLPGLNMARLEPAFSGAMTQPLFGQRQISNSNLPPSSAMIYPGTAPFFGCTPIPFPASFTFNPLSIAPDSPFTVTALGTGIGMSSQAGGGQRAVTPIVRPPFVMNIADLGAANGIYTWGRSDLNLTGSTGSTIINCRDLGASGKEQFLYHGGSASLEEQTRFIQQQAALPVAPLKRKEPECSWEQSRTGFKQPSCKHKSWH